MTPDDVARSLIFYVYSQGAPNFYGMATPFRILDTFTEAGLPRKDLTTFQSLRPGPELGHWYYVLDWELFWKEAGIEPEESTRALALARQALHLSEGLNHAG